MNIFLRIYMIALLILAFIAVFVITGCKSTQSTREQDQLNEQIKMQKKFEQSLGEM